MKLTAMNFAAIVAVALASAMSAGTAIADEDFSIEATGKGGGKGGPKTGGSTGDTTTPTYSVRDWMNSDISAAWDQGYFGQGTTITVVDDFSSQWGYYGDLGDGTQLHRHGEWTYLESGMVAPEASMKAHDFNSGNRVRLSRKGLNTLNLSYGMMAAAGYDVSQIGWSAQEQSIISYAKDGRAVISKAAGNDGVAIGSANADGLEDYLGTALIGAQSALFVGALDHNGSTSNPASLAYYSNYAGSDATVQDQFLVVGVEGGMTGLYGTSFAAPVVSGYSALLGSKFKSANPAAIKQQLLDTARSDTISGYSEAIHGQGEASISRAIAPSAIQ